MKKLLQFMFIFLIFAEAVGQVIVPGIETNTQVVKRQNIETPKKIQSILNSNNSQYEFIYDTTKWSSLIDVAWGEGIPTNEKLAIFDHYWDTISTTYASFPNLKPINWDSAATAFRSLIAQGVSRGRFLSIMNQLQFHLNDGHTIFRDFEIYYSDLYPGLPLVNPEGHYNFAGCLTILPDSTALVYSSVPNNVFNLKAGDIILGYNNIPLKNLAQEIIKHQIPVQHTIGSTYEATWHNLLIHVASSWNLFDTINILKYNGEIENYPANLMIGKQYISDCYEIIPPKGIRLPRYMQLINRGNQFAYGVIPSTNIGYVSMMDCLEFSGDSLYKIFKYFAEVQNVDGIILDIRTNFGGSISAFNKAFAYIYDEDLINWFACADRVNSTDRFLLKEDKWTYGYNLYQDDNFYFDKPIALLTGPNAISAGDVLTTYFKNHKRLKIFGKPTAAAFGAVLLVDINQQGKYLATMQSGNFFLLSEQNKYLSHSALEIDFPVWLSKDGVHNGEDDVINSAVNWINSSTDITDEYSDNSEFMIFPNPVSNMLNVKNYKPDGLVQIYNILGVKVIETEMSDRIDVSELPTGLYIIRSNGQSRKFIKN